MRIPIEGLVSADSPIADPAPSMVKLSIWLKSQILEKLAESQATQSSVAKHFVVSRKTIQNVIADKKLLRGVEMAKHSHKKCHLKVEQKYENADETALFYRLLPGRKIEGNRVSAAGKNFSKERVTVLLCCSVLQMKPAIISDR